MDLSLAETQYKEAWVLWQIYLAPHKEREILYKVDILCNRRLEMQSGEKYR